MALEALFAEGLRGILWAGDFPAAINAAAARQLVQDLPVVLVSGE